MVAVIDSFLAALGPQVAVALDVIFQVLQLVGILLVVGYGLMLYKFDIKVNVREHAKGNRVIVSTTRAYKFRDKTTGAPKLKFFGTMGFRGETTNEPPAECLVPYKSRVTTKLYDFVKKDGLYYPVNNFIQGIKKETIDEKGNKREVWDLEGSGLEIHRDYDAEQAIQNTLIEKATAYRNKKPTEIIASYALMIIVIIGSFVIMWYAWRTFGNIAGAIASLNEPLRQGIVEAAQNVLGPG